MPATTIRRFVCTALASMSLLAPAQGGTFKNPELIDTSYDPAGVATADFNHDGNPDIVYVDGTGPSVLHILLGNGSGTFSHGQDIVLPQGSCGNFDCVINLADVTNDGNTDIIVGGSGTSSGLITVLVGKVFVVRICETSLARGPSYGLSFSSTLGFWFQRPRL